MTFRARERVTSHDAPEPERATPFEALDEDDITSGIGAEVIDPLLQRATNPD